MPSLLTLVDLVKRRLALLLPASVAVAALAAGCAASPALPPPPALPPVSIDLPRPAPAPSVTAEAQAAAPPPEPPAAEAPAAGPPPMPECAPGIELWEGEQGTVLVLGGDSMNGLRFYDLEGWQLESNVTTDPKKSRTEVAFSAHRTSDRGGPDMVLAFLLRRAGNDLLGNMTRIVEQALHGTEKVSFSRTCPPLPARPGKAGGGRKKKR